MPMNEVVKNELLSKIKNVMKSDWSLTVEPEGFILTQPKNTTRLSKNELWSETWRVARMVKLDKFLSIEEETAGYLVLSRDDEDNWFQMLVE
jgi:hypothetical protein